MTRQDWYKLGWEEALKNLGSSKNGLEKAEVEKRRKEYGLNQLPSSAKLPNLLILLNQFRSSLVYILVIAAVITFILGDFIDAYVIIAAVIINVIVGFIQEARAQKAIEKLKKIIEFTTLVFRGSKEEQVDIKELVPGDIIILAAGDKVPADARIITCRNLKVNEASLTGEPFPIEKNNRKIEKDVSLPDRMNMIYMGTVITEGTALACVVETGLETQIGQIAKLIRETKEEETPLQKRLSGFSRWLAWVILVICLVLFFIGLLSGKTFLEMLTTSVAVAVAAIPEGLIITVTIILSLGMMKILKHKALVRKLIAAETLGSTTVICTDKTGTLTEGLMHVANIITHEHDLETDKHDFTQRNGDESFDLALRIGMICNDAFVENEDDDLKDWKVIGNPTERALLVAGDKLGLRKSHLDKAYPRLDEIPFDSDCKYMVTLNKFDNEQNIILIKGAPEKILAMSDEVDLNGKIIKLIQDKKDILTKQYAILSNKGLRILALAFKKVPREYNTLTNFGKEESKNLVFVGFLGIKDPLRLEAKQTVKICQEAGIKVVMMTGDHKLTARAIAEELGLKVRVENIIEGEELDKMSDHELKSRVKQIDVYARVSPKNKLKIVEAWQANNEVVAMTGDGVNDAPALKLADIGIALGSGTDVAKETADIVLLDNNFKTIEMAIEQGRLIYENIRKVILYLLSNSFCEIIIIGVGLILKFPLPLLATQILWVNVISDTFPGIALSVEPEEREVMKEPPKKINTPILNKPMKVLSALISISIALIVLIAFYFIWQRTGDEARARTVGFTILGISTLFYIFSTRSLRYSIFKINPFSNIYLVLAIFSGIILQLLAIYFAPLQKIMRSVALSWNDWLIVVLATIFIIILIEITKYYFILKRRKV